MIMGKGAPNPLAVKATGSTDSLIKMLEPIISRL
jgi:hypothetical protein